MARRGFSAFENLALPAGTIDDHAPLPVDPHQRIVILPLQPRFTDNVALGILRKLGGVQFGLGYFAYIPDSVRGETVAGIQAPLVLDQLHLRISVSIPMR